MMYGQLIIVTVAEELSEVNVFNIKSESVTIGRYKDNTLAINNGFVSSHHGYMKYMNGAFYYVDKDSANGTYFNGKPMRKSDEKNMYPVVLNDGDVLFIGDSRSKNGIYIVYSAFTDDNYCWRTLDLEKNSELSIGRSKTNNIAILNNNVSANHAKIVNSGDGVNIYDLNSTNGVVVNLNRVSGSQKIYDYDKIKVDDSLFVLIGKKMICGIKKIYLNNVPSRVLRTSISENSDIQSINEKIQDKKIKENKCVREYEEREGTLVVLSSEKGKIKINQYDASNQTLLIGRGGSASNCNVKIENSLISREHAIIKRANGCFWYVEKGINKFAFNGKNNDFVQPNQKRRLNDRDYMILGDVVGNNGVLMYFIADSNTPLNWKVCRIKGNELSIGRSSNNDICLPLLSISREHAKIVRNTNSYTLVDKKSANGIFVNHSLIRKQKDLSIGDCIDIVNSKIIFMGDYILYGIPQNVVIEPGNKLNVLEKRSGKVERVSKEKEYKYAFNGGMNVELEHISRMVPCKAGTGINGGNKKYILMDISCRIGAGQLVAILGGSGAGKTTFMNCINGFEPATSGTVKINGKELYQNYHALKTQIGYVPQQDIIHDELTLKSMLTYVAKLRLPKDISKVEIAQKVSEVIEMVDLTEHANTLIKKMSGGQRKRASIAVELLCDPELFFLDEPTSGLDPEAETHLMKRLQLLAHKEGKTVIVITHTLQNIHLFDKVVFLAPGGRLCFYGSPENAKRFFGVDNLSDAYEKISMDIDGYVEKFDKGRKIS